MNSNIASIAQMAMVNNQLPPDDFDSPPQSQDGTNGTKRKADDGGQPQQRAKRNRYISIACNECKRRKIKCNGNTPCQRCGNMNLECVYAPNCCNGFKDSQEYKDMVGAVSHLQEQFNVLYNDLNSLRAHVGSGAPMQQHPPPQQRTPIDPTLQTTPFPPQRPPSYPPPQASPGAPIASMSPSAPRPKSQSQSTHPTFRGPTSADFNFGVAKSSLSQMGITSGQNDGPRGGSGGAGTGTREPSPIGTPPPSQQYLQTWNPDKDPLWTIPQDEALRLCRVYEDEMGLMYPVLDIEFIIAYARQLYGFMEAAHRTGLMQQGMPGTDGFDDENTSILKLVIATALTVEAAGRSDLGKKMFERVQPAVDNCLLGNVGLKGIQMLAMAAMYEFHSDRESTSWRLIGLTARLCIEHGLHRQETYDAMLKKDEKNQALLIFWSVYVLDRRWSFGTGMPFALQDADIDQSIERPESRSPYLHAMVDYSAIGANVWHSVISTSAAGNAPINIKRMEDLDRQIVQWHTKVPQHLYFDSSKIGRIATPAEQPQTRAGRRLPLLLYLRRNQMRILIYRSVLHSATSIMAHRDQAHKVVDIARDTIRVLTHIKQTSDLYDTQQMLFNAFLASALAVLFLAVAHTPAIFAESVREEYYMGIDLVRGFSKDSYVGKRLWKSVRVLLDVAPKLGLISKDKENDRRSSHPAKGELDPSRTAAVAMAGLAGHNVDEMALYQGTPQGWHTDMGSSNSPEALAADLTSLFEAAGGWHPMGNGSIGGGHDQAGLFSAPSNGNDGIDLGPEEVSNILKELF